MTEAAVACVKANCQEGVEVDIESICQWAVGAAVRKLAEMTAPPKPIDDKPPAEPVQANDGAAVGNIHERGPTALGGPVHVLRKAARGAGYTGNVCGSCGSLNMRRSGTCETCDNCGSTSGGCS